MDIRKLVVKMWTGISWLRILFSGSLLWWIIGFPNNEYLDKLNNSQLLREETLKQGVM